MKEPWFDIVRGLDGVLRAAAAGMAGGGEGFRPEVRPADPRFGDFQANGVLPWAKARRENPRQLALNLVAAVQSSALLPQEWGVQLEVAGPGFINFRFSAAFLLAWVRAYHRGEALRAAARSFHGGRRVVVDYASPNTAKQMHVGHLRSMVIGESIQRLLRFCGAEVIRDNHIGDWGTQFGILIMAIQRAGVDLDTLGEEAMETLERLYKEGSRLTQEEDSALAQAREALVRLQEGDPASVALWEKITTVSQRAFEEVYRLLGIEFDHTLGESFYRDKVGRVYAELESCGLSEESEGAQVVFHREHPRFSTQPFIVRKSDGASNYASTDLATVLYRVEAWGADTLVYVTDGRQRDHFEQLFLTVGKWFPQRGYALPQMRHVWFGTVLGEDGKAIKTRSGDPVRLKDLLAEALERARQIVDEKNAGLSPHERERVARAVGIGAVRYADLSQTRTHDYVFNWERLLSFEGNTAPYLQYAAVRVHSLFRKAGVTLSALDGAGATAFETEAEMALTRKLMQFPVSLGQAVEDLCPHVLCNYLYELAGEFSTFYNADKVLAEEAGVRERRLLLCACVVEYLELGLGLLGIEPLERM